MTEKALRTGLSTGSCATAAAVAALHVLLGGDAPRSVWFTLPRDGIRSMDILRTEHGGGWAEATVRKDGGDDPDATHGALIRVRVAFAAGTDISFRGGDGVGRVTLPGLGLDIGEPAINPVPRLMIADNLRRYYRGGLEVTVSVPEGRSIARRTFNAKVGVVGGISILGTTGIVHPFSNEAFIDCMRREMEVAMAMRLPRLVLNSGKRSELTIRARYSDLPDQAFIHYGNFIGDALRLAERLGVPRLTLGVMIGKAVKLAAGFDNTHSHQVTMDRQFVTSLAHQAGCSNRTIGLIGGINMARQLITDLPVQDFERLGEVISRLCRETAGRIYSGELEFILLTNL
ncbi:MAG: cobalamin biosynthesis protein CbiD [Bacteroidaceae bacterium]|nr:cobalamin biosynthesis protein CbiD [Bacteroidaceae bacterium]